MVSCRHAVVPRLNETSVSQRASEKWGEKEGGERGGENVGFKGSRRRRDQNLRETVQRRSPSAMPCLVRPSRNIVILGIICRPREEQGIKRSLKTNAPTKSSLFKEGARGVVMSFVSRLKRGGEIRFPFPAALEFHPLLVREGE